MYSHFLSGCIRQSHTGEKGQARPLPARGNQFFVFDLPLYSQEEWPRLLVRTRHSARPVHPVHGQAAYQEAAAPPGTGDG